MNMIQTGNLAQVFWQDLCRGVEFAEPVQGQPSMSLRLFRVWNRHEVRPVTHSSDQVVFILTGECDYYVSGKPYRMGPGAWITVPAGAEHYIYVYNSPEPCIYTEFCVPASPPPIGELPEPAGRMRPGRSTHFRAYKR